MRGKVLSYQDLEGTGVVSGDDGNRYNFVRGDLQDGVRTVRAGQDVDFEVSGDKASKVFVIGGAAASSGSVGDGINQALSSVGQGQKSRIVAAILAILLGALGIHKFYLGMQKEGIIMLAICLVGSIVAGIGPMLMGLVGLVEGIIYLTKSDAQFQEEYVIGKKAWF